MTTAAACTSDASDPYPTWYLCRSERDNFVAIVVAIIFVEIVKIAAGCALSKTIRSAQRTTKAHNTQLGFNPKCGGQRPPTRCARNPRDRCDLLGPRFYSLHERPRARSFFLALHRVCSAVGVNEHRRLRCALWCCCFAFVSMFCCVCF